MATPPHDQLKAVVRGLTTTERDGEEMRLLTAERSLPAEVEEVWDALTSPERVPRWFGGAVSDDLREGGRFQLEGNAGGEVLTCAPPRELSITWEYGGQISWVDVTLATVPGGTWLLLEHTAPVDPDMWDRFGPGASASGGRWR
ncbi:MAG TPA: SRPBCC domain-containing protein [Nocardioidaceae bacterium]|nr:SRPBCC domain-containing protein [Nocardioidaceae bacterium]